MVTFCLLAQIAGPWVLETQQVPFSPSTFLEEEGEFKGAFHLHGLNKFPAKRCPAAMLYVKSVRVGRNSWTHAWRGKGTPGPPLQVKNGAKITSCPWERAWSSPGLGLHRSLEYIEKPFSW